jgi:hypothetical protein
LQSGSWRSDAAVCRLPSWGEGERQFWDMFPLEAMHYNIALQSRELETNRWSSDGETIVMQSARFGSRVLATCIEAWILGPMRGKVCMTAQTPSRPQITHR